MVLLIKDYFGFVCVFSFAGNNEKQGNPRPTHVADISPLAPLQKSN